MIILLFAHIAMASVTMILTAMLAIAAVRIKQASNVKKSTYVGITATSVSGVALLFGGASLTHMCVAMSVYLVSTIAVIYAYNSRLNSGNISTSGVY